MSTIGSTGSDGMSFDTKGIEVFIEALNKVEQSPQKAVNKGTSKAILTVKRAVRSAAPVRTGTLRRNIVTKAERNKGKKGKKMRQVTFKGGQDANAVLQKPIQHPGALGGKSPKAYYPSSMEYGFLARAPGGGTVYYSKGVFQTKKQASKRASWTAKETGSRQAAATQQIPGKHFMRDAAEAVSEQAKTVMIDVMTDELEKLWKEASHS